MTTDPLTVDVREELRGGGEPLPRILHAVTTLLPGQALRLLATFEPLPLYAVLARKGYEHQARHLAAGDWEVLFTPKSSTSTESGRDPGPIGSATGMTEQADSWPRSTITLDNRGLDPPHPLMRILGALEQLSPGEVLEALNDRDPVFLYPELEDRNAAIKTEALADGGVRILIRSGVVRP